MINVEKNKKHVVVTFGPDEHDMLTMAPVKITLSEKEAEGLVSRICSVTGKAVATRRAVAAAEKVLVDNGIEEDEAATVLQAVGYALAGIELYPANYTERRLVEVEPTGESRLDQAL